MRQLKSRFMIFALFLLILPLRAETRTCVAETLNRKEKPAAETPLAACLPKGVRADDIVVYGRNKQPDVTVAKTLEKMKVRCRKGKLVDAKTREVRFFRQSCWGHPPPDYLDIRRREKAELAELEKKYTVIVFGCSPRLN
jgi:hypothetical protein